MNRATEHGRQGVGSRRAVGCLLVLSTAARAAAARKGEAHSLRQLATEQDCRAAVATPAREADRFGIGWYGVKSSNEIGPILQGVFGPVGDGQGVELFYNYKVTLWFHLTPDLQVLFPARENVDDALVLGLRGKMDF